MADDIQLKRSNVPGLAPAAGELLDGELAFNTYDGKLYAKDASGSVFVVNPSASLVDIVAGSANVTVEIAAGVATVSVDAPSVSWGDIVGRPTKVSELANDSGFVNALDAADASPVQGIVGSNAAIVTTVGRLFTVDVPLQQQANWAESNDTSVSFVQNKPTAVSQFDNDSGFVTAAGAAAAAPVQDIAGGGAVSVSSVDGVFTISSPATVQADWDEADFGNPAFIQNKPTALSQFSNDAGYVTAAGAIAAAPVQSIAAADSSIIVSVDGVGNYTIGVSLGDQVQSDWSQEDSSAASFILHKPTALSQFSNDELYVDAAGAAAAAPVQSVSGAGAISVQQSTGDVTVSADSATAAAPGVVQLADATAISAGTPGRVVDAAQLKGAVPTAVSQLSNDLNFAKQADITAAVANYLPLSGGQISGPLSVSGSFTATTPPQQDASTQVATTEYVQRELGSLGQQAAIWEYDGEDVATAPPNGTVRVSADQAYIAISKSSSTGAGAAVESLGSGDYVVLTTDLLAVASVPSPIATEGDSILTTELDDIITVE